MLQRYFSKGTYLQRLIFEHLTQTVSFCKSTHCPQLWGEWLKTELAAWTGHWWAWEHVLLKILSWVKNRQPGLAPFCSSTLVIMSVISWAPSSHFWKFSVWREGVNGLCCIFSLWVQPSARYCCPPANHHFQPLLYAPGVLTLWVDTFFFPYISGMTFSAGFFFHLNVLQCSFEMHIHFSYLLKGRLGPSSLSPGKIKFASPLIVDNTSYSGGNLTRRPELSKSNSIDFTEAALIYTNYKFIFSCEIYLRVTLWYPTDRINSGQHLILKIMQKLGNSLF